MNRSIPVDDVKLQLPARLLRPDSDRRIDPGRNDTSVFARRESVVRGYCRRFQTMFSSARGSLVRDVAGREYIDFLAGCSALNYGHNDPDLAAALIAHIRSDGIAMGLDLHTEAKRAFLERFEEVILIPRGMDHRVQFTGPTGANAIEAALKLARRLTGRTHVIAFTSGYHGVTLGALAPTPGQQRRMQSPLTRVSRAPFDGDYGAGVDTAELLDRMLSDPFEGIDPPAAILLETVQGEGGLNVASAKWVRHIAALAQKHGALFIVDDVQAGCGRTGTFFSFENMGVMPDLVVLSKSLSGFGLPMAILMIRPKHDIWQPAEHNGSFRGNNHAFVTACATLEKFWTNPRFGQQIAERTDIVTLRLQEIGAQIPGARVKGRGMMQGLAVGSGELADRICRCSFQGGLIIETSGAHDEVVNVFAPLTTPIDTLEHGLHILAAAVRRALETGPVAVHG